MIDAEEAAKLRGLLRHSGWLDVVRPRLISRGRSCIQTLVQSEAERPKDQKSLSDDHLRGWYRALEWVLTNWEQELRVYEHNKKAENGEPVEAANPLERS